MSRSISFPEARKNTEDKQVPPAREPSAESLRWKRRLIATLATISLFTLLKLGFDSRTKEKIDEIPFLTQAGILQLNSIAAADDDTLGVLVQHDGVTYQDLTGWNDTERARLEKD